MSLRSQRKMGALDDKWRNSRHAGCTLFHTLTRMLFSEPSFSEFAMKKYTAVATPALVRRPTWTMVEV